MPYYKDDQYFTKVNALNGSQFDRNYGVSTRAPKAGIYRCTGCGHEIAIAEGHILPPDGQHDHPLHNLLLGIRPPYQWQLVAQAKHVRDRS